MVTGAGDKQVNGVYEHKCLDDDYFEKIGSVQEQKHSNTPNKPEHNDEAKTQPKRKGRFEIDRHEYLQNPDDIPDPRLSKSGFWVLSRTDIYPKRLLYAVNCPFKQIKVNGWITLKDGTHPPPKIKLFGRKTHGHKSQKAKKKTMSVKDTIQEIQREHHDASGNALNVMQLKAIRNASQQKIKNTTLMIASGGQAGVDRAALDVAISLNIAHCGWVPKGFKAEDGAIDQQRYPGLKECDSEKYDVRTLLNVVDSDATLLLTMGKLEGGTLTTKKFAAQKNKDLMFVALYGRKPVTNSDSEASEQKANESDTDGDYSFLGFSDGRAQRVSEWIRCRQIRVLNVAGPRESDREGIYEASVRFLTDVLLHFENGDIPSQALF